MDSPIQLRLVRTSPITDADRQDLPQRKQQPARRKPVPPETSATEGEAADETRHELDEHA